MAVTAIVMACFIGHSGAKYCSANIWSESNPAFTLDHCAEVNNILRERGQVEFNENVELQKLVKSGKLYSKCMAPSAWPSYWKQKVFQLEEDGFTVKVNSINVDGKEAEYL